VVRALTEKRTTLTIALTTFVTEIVTSASGTTIRAMSFSTISNCRADQNARSSSTAIIGTNSTARTVGHSQQSGHFGWWPNAICTTRATSLVTPGNLTSVTCETNG